MPVVCWSCGRPSADGEACAWCGVWLASLDPEQVPPAVRPLLALARRWGIGDDGYRWDAIEHADRRETEAIVLALGDDVAQDEVERWLVGPEADASQPSREYVAVTCLIMAANHARLRLAEQHGAPSISVRGPGTGGLAAGPAAEDGQMLAWPVEKLKALRLSRRLVAEVPARLGRRAFVDITAVADDRDRLAEREGWQRTDPDRSYRLEHWDYDEQQISGWDYDIGAERVRTGAAADEAALLKLIAAWGLRPADFEYPWNTADPR